MFFGFGLENNTVRPKNDTPLSYLDSIWNYNSAYNHQFPILQCEVIEFGDPPIRDLETRQAVVIATAAAATAVLAAFASC